MIAITMKTQDSGCEVLSFTRFSVMLKTKIKINNFELKNLRKIRHQMTEFFYTVI